MNPTNLPIFNFLLIRFLQYENDGKVIDKHAIRLCALVADELPLASEEGFSEDVVKSFQFLTCDAMPPPCE